MKFLGKESELYGFALTANELMLVISAISSTSGGMATPAPEVYLAKMGASRDRVTELLSRLKDKSPPSHMPSAARPNDPEHDSMIRVSWDGRELKTIVRCIDELANGTWISDWEFQTLTGFARDDMRRLLHLLHRPLVNKGKDLEALKT